MAYSGNRDRRGAEELEDLDLDAENEAIRYFSNTANTNDPGKTITDNDAPKKKRRRRRRREEDEEEQQQNQDSDPGELRMNQYE